MLPRVRGQQEGTPALKTTTLAHSLEKNWEGTESGCREREDRWEASIGIECGKAGGLTWRVVMLERSRSS